MRFLPPPPASLFPTRASPFLPPTPIPYAYGITLKIVYGSVRALLPPLYCGA